MYPLKIQKSENSNSSQQCSELASLYQQLSDLMENLQQAGDICVALANYSLPTRFSLDEMNDTVNIAENTGIVKLVLNKFNPQYLLCDGQEVMRYMGLSMQQRKSPQSIRECGDFLWRDHSTYDKSISFTDATSYLMARYNFMTHIVDEFSRECKNSNPGSYLAQFYRDFQLTYIARYWVKLSKKYSEIDMNMLPQDVLQVVIKVMLDV